MNEMQIFENSEFGKIRTAGTSENPLFCLADLCKALEIGNPSDVKNRLDDGVVSIEVISDSIGRKQQMIFVNEDGLYDVILDSRKPEAKRFRKWITSEVLPSIRKTGSYSISNQMKGDEVQIIGKMAADIQSLFAVKRGIALSKAIELVSLNNNLNLEELKKLLPLAEHDTGYLNPTQIGEKLGIKAKEVNKLLEKNGLQFKENGLWRITATGSDYGEEIPYSRHGHCGYQIRWNKNILSVLGV